MDPRISDWKLLSGKINLLTSLGPKADKYMSTKDWKIPCFESKNRSKLPSSLNNGVVPPLMEDPIEELILVKLSLCKDQIIELISLVFLVYIKNLKLFYF
jgi:hypothetical protein